MGQKEHRVPSHRISARNTDMKLFSYIVAIDDGFAPNPFFRICTLATCKPDIRKGASIGDWIIGTGSKEKHRQGYLVYAMCVTETMTFNEYWEDERFERKKPNLKGSLKQVSGDNIYFKDDTGSWCQQHSYHSKEDGSPHPDHIKRDTKRTDRVLISKDYAYWGGSGPEIPTKFRNYNNYNEKYDICCDRQGYKCNFPEELVNAFVTWFRFLNVSGYLGEPLDWP